MGIGLAVIGIIIGAAGSEVLRKKKPELVKKVEDAASRFVDKLFLSKDEADK